MRSIKIGKKDKIISQDDFFKLFENFINELYMGRKLKKNGKRLSRNTIKNYENLRNTLLFFKEENCFEIKLFIIDRISQERKEQIRRYWINFYNKYTNFLYSKLNYFDNYVGLLIKNLKSFLNYLINDKCLSIGYFHKQFYVPHEEIPIIVLNQQQLRYIINNQEFNQIVAQHNLEKTKDVFIVGCTIALRVSDLLSLSRSNLIVQQEKYYIKVKSQKTNTYTSIKLPE